MRLYGTRLFVLATISALGCVGNLSAQERTDELMKKLQAVENRIEEARRREQELLKQQDDLFRQLLKQSAPEWVTRQEAVERLAKDRAWASKYRPAIEVRARLQSKTHTSTLLLYPPPTFTSWFIMMDGHRISLDFGKSVEPTNLRNAEEADVLIKGKLEVLSPDIMVPRGSAKDILIIRMLIIHVESLTKVAAK
jgi:hypothetical protein